MDAVKNKKATEETEKELEKRTKAFEEQKDKVICAHSDYPNYIHIITQVRDLIVKVEGKQGDMHKSMKAFVELHEKLVHEQHIALQEFAKTL